MNNDLITTSKLRPNCPCGNWLMGSNGKGNTFRYVWLPNQILRGRGICPKEFYLLDIWKSSTMHLVEQDVRGTCGLDTESSRPFCHMTHDQRSPIWFERDVIARKGILENVMVYCNLWRVHLLSCEMHHTVFEGNKCLCAPKSRTKRCGKDSLRFQGPRLWNIILGFKNF